MTQPIKLATKDIRHGPSYDAEKLNQLQQQVNQLTRVNQKLLQMLQGGSAGQVLTRKDGGDLLAEWLDP